MLIIYAQKRMGLIVYRIAMIFTAFRNMDNISSIMICSDKDFDNAMSMGEVLLKHSKHAFQGLKEAPIVKHLVKDKEKFLNALPDEFDRSTFKEVAKSTGINERTAERYVRQFCDNKLINHEKQNHYKRKSNNHYLNKYFLIHIISSFFGMFLDNFIGLF